MRVQPRKLSEEKVIRVLVIQMAPLAQTLQSLMALRAAKQLYPQVVIDLLVRDESAEVASQVPWLHQVLTFPCEMVPEGAPEEAAAADPAGALLALEQWADPLFAQPWDLAVNWTYTEASSYLVSLIPAKVKLGFTRRRDGSFFAADGWSHYIQGVVAEQVTQNIHFTDILTTQLLTSLQIHLGAPQSAGQVAVTSREFFNLPPLVSLSPQKRWVAIDLLGAADDPSDALSVVPGPASSSGGFVAGKLWAQVAFLLLTRHQGYGLVLLGRARGQARLAAEVELFFAELKRLGWDGTQEIQSRVSHLSYTEMASALSGCQWLLSADPAALSLGSVLGVRVLQVARPRENFYQSGPYGNGHLLVVPPYQSGAENKEPEEGEEGGLYYSPSVPGKLAWAIYGVWAYGIHEWAHFQQVSLEKYFAQTGWSEALEQVAVYRARIRHSNDGGGVVYESLKSQPLTMDEWMGKVMGHVARAWYCGWTPQVGQELRRASLHLGLLQELRALKESAVVMEKIFSQAQLLAQKLEQKALSLRSSQVMDVQDQLTLKSLAAGLADLEMLVDRVALAQPRLQGFAGMAKVLMHHLRAHQVSAVAQESAACYQQLAEGVKWVQEWIDFTLALGKPAVVQELKPPLTHHLTLHGRDLSL